MTRVLELEKEYLAQGHEGVMVLPDIPYYLGRKSGGLLKFKTMLSRDCEVIGMYEGKDKYSKMMGGLIVKQENNLICECVSQSRSHA